MAITAFMLDRVEDELAKASDESEKHWQMYCDAHERAEKLEENNAELVRVLNVVWDAYSSILPNTRQALIRKEPLLEQVLLTE